jgi:hypothetical protein
MQTMPTSKIQNLSPFLKIYKRMKVIITKDLYPKFGIVNGNNWLCPKHFNQKKKLDSLR